MNFAWWHNQDGKLVCAASIYFDVVITQGNQNWSYNCVPYLGDFFKGPEEAYEGLQPHPWSAAKNRLPLFHQWGNDHMLELYTS